MHVLFDLVTLIVLLRFFHRVKEMQTVHAHLSVKQMSLYDGADRDQVVDGDDDDGLERGVPWLVLLKLMLRMMSVDKRCVRNNCLFSTMTA